MNDLEQATIRELAERMWRVHPREIQDLGITRQQFYELEITKTFKVLRNGTMSNGNVYPPKLGCRRCGGWGHVRNKGERVKCDLCNGTGDEPRNGAGEGMTK
jgi:DnaJ-class molecular chaperone